jgi:hypothetical protein
MLVFNIIGNIIVMIGMLNIFALILIIFRNDRLMVLKDLFNMFQYKSLAYYTISIVSLFFFLLPFSIPFSIMHIIDNSND